MELCLKLIKAYVCLLQRLLFVAALHWPEFNVVTTSKPTTLLLKRIPVTLSLASLLRCLLLLGFLSALFYLLFGQEFLGRLE